MIRTQSLTSLEAAFTALLEGLAPVAPVSLPLADALGCVAADMPTAGALPPKHVAVIDGWAFRSSDTVGAGSYSPVVVTAEAIWVEVGKPLPDGCDCVLEPGLVETVGSVVQILAEAVPGQGVRRAGEDMAAGRPVLVAGRAVTDLDLLVARSVRLDELSVRRPAVRLIDVAAMDGRQTTSHLIAGKIRAASAWCNGIERVARDAAAIAGLLGEGSADLTVLVGGTGVGRSDATVEALAARGALIVHRIALRPGQSTAIGRIDDSPVLALPGAPDQALAAWLALVQPVLDRLMGRVSRRDPILPLARKISSVIGVTEIALVKEENASWMPLAVGDMPLDLIRCADAWLSVPGDSEGFAAGTPVGAFRLHEIT
jgi:molybdopterin molybdotransferase